MTHPNQTLCCRMSKVCPFQSRLRDLPGLGHGAWAGQDPRTPKPTQKYFAVSNEPKHGASHSSLPLDRENIHSILQPLRIKTHGVLGRPAQGQGTLEEKPWANISVIVQSAR